MKLHLLLSGVVMVTNTLVAASLPVITMQPQNQTVAPGGNATLNVIATGAASYQWRFNGADISGATNSTLQITNAQAANGYYMVVVKNDTGWIPSQLVYLSINFDIGGTVPFSNSGNASAQAYYQYNCFYSPITNGTAKVVAGPELDQMLPVGTSKSVANGYFSPSVGNRTVPTVAPGQTVCYRVNVTHTNSCNAIAYTQQSTVRKLVAGGGGYPVPSSTNLYFPIWLEWPDPIFIGSTSTIRSGFSEKPSALPMGTLHAPISGLLPSNGGKTERLCLGRRISLALEHVATGRLFSQSQTCRLQTWEFTMSRFLEATGSLDKKRA
jgi:Immunoglobulin domain